ncbi:cation diffusion facilitator family transporter [Mycobacterium paraffinicum]|nr:cation diffusion facilitator family transporter [Mycobacterium paraffinicum]MCV7309401.1 cation transporter [Mycobacterium paraffinicum]
MAIRRQAKDSCNDASHVGKVHGLSAEVVATVQHGGAGAHDQQERIVGGADALMGDLDAVVVGGQGAHAASIIGKMSKAARLGLVLGLNLLLVAALVIVGLAAHSLGVLAAGVDYLADAAAIGVSVPAIWLTRQPLRQQPRRWADPTHIAALVNAGWLLALNVGVVVTAIRRLASGTPEIHGLPVLVVSASAAVVMLIGAIIVGGDLDDDDGGEDLNVKAVVLDTAADAAAASGVAVTGAVILATHGWYWLDPAVALAIAVVIGYHAVVLIWRVVTAIKTQPTSQAAEGPSENS